MSVAPGADRLARLKQLFDESVELSAHEREAFLAARAASEPELASELRELLEHHARAQGFLEAGFDAPSAADAAGGPRLDGLELPGYRLHRELGRGAVGVVYLAEQHAPRRHVAIKLLRLDSLGEESLARFRREAQILARLRHPGIAQVLEAGLASTVHGELPWIALEYAPGEPIDAWIAARSPALRELVALFVKLCDAVDHAHQRGVVHRDLKPSNVLVDARGELRVLDFGIARLTEESDEPAVRTRTGAFLGTLAYAAPEQLSATRADADARIDVHALGVMLFELATGALPYPIDETRVLETIRSITRDEPLTLRRLRADAPIDLETIVRKALEKDPRRRYANAGALRDDLQRWLAGRPVLARPPSSLYQAQMLVRRHPAATAAATVAIAGLIVAVVALSVSGRRIKTQLAETAGALESVSGLLFGLAPRLGWSESESASLARVEQLLARQIERDPANRRLLRSRAQALFHLSALDVRAGAGAQAFARADDARRILELLVESDPSDLAAATLLSQTYARLGEARRELGDREGELAWSERALELDDELVALHPGDFELVEDRGWSLTRLVSLERLRGQDDRAFELATRRLEEAAPLVAAEPDNPKYIYNYADALLFAAGGHRDRGQQDQARRYAGEMLRQARRLVELQPDNRDYVMCLLISARCATEIAVSQDDCAAAAEHAQLAFETAVERALREPRNQDHPWHVLEMGMYVADLAPQSEWPERATQVLAAVGAVLAPWDRAATQPPSVQSLRAFVERTRRELETRGR